MRVLIGCECFIEGTDKYCKTGMAKKNAIKKIMTQLNKAKKSTKNTCVIIDTCGDGDHGNTNNVFFNVDFDGWTRIDIFPNFLKDDLEGYLCWSLRNVLKRGAPSKQSNFYLTPATASVKVRFHLAQNH